MASTSAKPEKPVFNIPAALESLDFAVEVKRAGIGASDVFFLHP